MENIIEPDETFDFSKLTLTTPTGVQGGAFFTKILFNNKPLLIQTSKSFTRQGFVKSGKKIYCDLMFDNTNEGLIHWFEKLEETCQNLIFKKSLDWFQNELELNDIENAFSSIIRVYKSGKYYLVRTNVKNINNTPYIKIYNENENAVNMEEITNETNIISILEIQGIKFTSRNFQFEIALKQVMVLNNEPFLDTFLIKKTNIPKTTSVEISNTLENIKTNVNSNINNLENTNDNQDNNNKNNNNNKIIDELLLENNSPQTKKELHINTNELDNKVNVTSNKITDNEINNLETTNNPNTLASSLDDLLENTIIDLNTFPIDETNELSEFDLKIENENEIDSISLKKPTQVYFELYKQAKNKAKEAKKMAIIAYLEAKNIKKTYMLDTINDSDSEFDAEIDEISESELEGL